MSSSITKTQGSSLLAVQSLASNATVISSVLSLTTQLAATIFIHFGRRSNTALTEGVQIRVEGSSKSSGDGHWYPLATFITQLAAVTSQAVNGTCNAAQAVVAMASTTGMSADYAATSPPGNRVYIDNGTIANSEFQVVKLVTANTSITLEDNLTNAQTGATVFPGAEVFVAQLDATAIGRVRVVIAANNTGQAVAVEVFAVTGDSIG